MKAVILAGGLGTRISEESGVRPKPMVEVGGKPLLWHIMKIYEANGINEFIILCGYKSHVIKDFFSNYSLYKSDVTFDFATNTITTHKNGSENWKVTLVETGDDTMTGGRLKRVKEYVGDETFCFTYGDGLTDLNIRDAIKFHKEQGVLATLTAVQPPGRFGVFSMHEDQTKLTSFNEKPKGDGAWINGGYFILEPEVFEYIDGDASVWEQEPLRKLAEEGKLAAYKYEGFWQNMDTLRDKNLLESLWKSNSAKWKVWS